MTEINEFGQEIGKQILNWQAAQYPTLEMLQGRYCQLEKIDLNNHAHALYKALNSGTRGESWTYLPYGPFDKFEEFSQWLQETATKPDTVLYAILDINTNQPLGICGFLRINPEHGVIEVGHLHYSKQLQKTILATEAMYLMMRYAFDECGYRRYEWKCNALNTASRNAALRLGFQFEGIFRQHAVYKQRNRDTAWFSILNTEWLTIRAEIETWLDPKNFTAEGKQIAKLRRSVV